MFPRTTTYQHGSNYYIGAEGQKKTKYIESINQTAVLRQIVCHLSSAGNLVTRNDGTEQLIVQQVTDRGTVEQVDRLEQVTKGLISSLNKLFFRGFST